MNAHSVVNTLAHCRAIITGSHFVYASGKHGSAYVNKDAVYPHVDEISSICLYMIENFSKDGVEVVIGPAQGGIILAQWTAFHFNFSRDKPVLAVFADKSGDKDYVIKRGYDKLIAGKKVLVVEDIITTGGSAKAVVALVKAAGGSVVGVSAICNRGAVTAEQLGVDKFCPLIELQLEDYPASECPLCQKGIPVRTDLGKGKEFLKSISK
jgi:orotate phosphoribosyltransferase